jgi:hypothetical protein
MTYSLGRIVHHDPRSLNYAAGVLPRKAIQSVQWKRRIPHFDQGLLGSCTGNAAAGLIVTDALGRTGTTQVVLTAEQADRTHGVFLPGTYTVDEDIAVQCYELNTRLDSFAGVYKPDDTGSSGLAAAKTLQALGLCDVYTHGFSIAALDSALQKGPVMAGTVWLNCMFKPDSSGVIKLDVSSPEAGGHEYIVSGLDVERDRYTIDNSWGDGWGVNGQAFISRQDMKWLLDQQGDVTIPHLLGMDAPVPVPAPVSQADRDLASAMKAWMAAKGL